MELKKKEIEDFQIKNPTFWFTQVVIWYDLCSQTEHIPECIKKMDNKIAINSEEDDDNDGNTEQGSSHIYETMYNALCFLVFPMQLQYSPRSRCIWKFVARNYTGFFCMSVGYWSEIMVKELSIIESFERFRGYAKGNIEEVNENSTLSLNYNPLRMRETYLGGGGYAFKRGPDDVNEKIDSEEDIERKAMFVKYLSAMTSCRSVLWQLIPGMTAFAILSVDLSTCPIFIFSKSIEDNNLLPPLFVPHRHEADQRRFRR